MHHPLVSVVLPVYNGEAYLKPAIESILGQIYTNFELIIINDGSTDNTAQIIESFHDQRIRVIYHPKNLGLDTSLNQTFAQVYGTYIARMDSDDISLPARLEKQVVFMESHPDFGLVGSIYANLNQKREAYEVGAQVYTPDEIPLALPSLNVFCHGSVMFRRSFWETQKLSYDHRFSPYEDYELWLRCSRLTKLYIIPEVLYLYMQNPQGMFLTQHTEMIDGASALGKKWQTTQPLPQLTGSFLKRCIRDRKKYAVKTMQIQGKQLPSNLTLAYQTYLYKLGLVYLRRKKLGGMVLLGISFLISPENWIYKGLSKFI
jgi:glycosyltransferase involved in cell wall biosynthesis